MHKEIRGDIRRQMETAIAKVSTVDDEVRRTLTDDLRLATWLLTTVHAPIEQFTPGMLINAAERSLSTRYRPDRR